MPQFVHGWPESDEDQLSEIGRTWSQAHGVPQELQQEGTRAGACPTPLGMAFLCSFDLLSEQPMWFEVGSERHLQSCKLRSLVRMFCPTFVALNRELLNLRRRHEFIGFA